MTEDEFWERYFQREHAAQGAILDQEVNTNLARLQQPQGKKRRVVKKPCRIFVTPYVPLDVDLTSTTEDYFPHEHLDPEDYKWNSSDFITQKYVNKNTLVMEHMSTLLSAETCRANSHIVVGTYRMPKRKRNSNILCSENDKVLLSDSSNVDLIPLHLASRHTHDSHEYPSTSEMTSKTNTGQDNIQVRKSGKYHLYPEKEQAMRYLCSGFNNVSGTDDDTVEEGNKDMKSAVRRTEESERYGQRYQSGLSQVQVELPAQFEEVLKRYFRQISELLRYFYHDINAYEHSKGDGVDSHDSIAPLLSKLSRIQDMLAEKIKLLMAEKKKLQMHTASSTKGKALQNAFRLIKQTSDLVYQAFGTWDKLNLEGHVEC